MKTLKPGTLVSILPAFRDSPEDGYGWRVVEDRGERVVLEAIGLLARSAVANPQQTVGREMVCEFPAPTIREMTDPGELRQWAINPADYFDGVKFYLATWTDRSGWYCSDENGDGFLVTVGNVSETFATTQEAENALWALVEVSG